jgi:molybdopterin-guanine dinucleotide biosynthesis protein A
VADLPRTGLSPEPPQQQDITGLVLAGGRGVRFDGSDKGLVEWRGTPLALHALNRLQPQVGKLLISANRNQDVYARWATVVSDAPGQQYAGPLAGICAGFAHTDSPWLAIVPCDLPQLPADTVARLASALGTAPAAHATADGRHALVCLLHRSSAASIRELFDAGERRIGAMYAALQSVAVPFAAGELANINGPADLAALGVTR